MASGGAAHAGLLVMRVWHQDGGLVAKLLASPDVDRPTEVASYHSSIDEVCDAVRRFLTDFNRAT